MAALQCWIMLFAVMSTDASSTRITASDDEASIKAVLHGMAHGDEVVFDEGVYTGACGVTISSSNVRIIGSQFGKTVFNCSHSSRHFHVLGSNVSIEMVELVDGMAACMPYNRTECGNCQCAEATSDGGQGGCVLVSSSAIFRNVSMSNCRTELNGGGIHAAPGAQIDLIGFSGFNCRAGAGGVVYVGNSAFMTLRGSSRLEGNSASYGGSLYGTSDSNIAVDGPVLFAGNSASSSGGALSTNGGHIEVTGGVMLLRNSAAQNGGAISALNQGSISIHDHVILRENSAPLGGVVALGSSGLHVADRVTFHANDAANGGAIFANPGTVVIQGEVNFTSHTVPGDGAVLYCVRSTVEVDGPVLIRENHAQGRGTFVGFVEVAMAFRNGVVCELNHAREGGCVYALANSAVLLVGRVSARGNTAAARGGVVAGLSGTAVTVQDSVVFEDNNVVQGAGGSVYVTSSTLHVSNRVLIEGGTAEVGGAVYGSYSQAYFGNDVNVTNGYSVGGGGALYLVQFGSVEMVGPVRVLNNYGYLGGAFLFQQYMEVRMRGDILVQGNSGGNGGALNMFLQTSVRADDGVVWDNNFGRWFGGTFFVQEFSTLTLQGSVVSNSESGWVGGAIHAVFRANIVLDGATLTHNSAARDGGAVDLDNAASLTATDARIEHNGVALRGGAINAYESSSVVLNSGTVVSQNAAGVGGGGIAVANDASLEVVGATIDQNQVTATRADCAVHPCGGGGISIADVGSVVLGEGAVLSDNSADTGGGLLLSQLATATIRGARVVGNRAVYGGGMASVNGTRLVVDGATCDDNRASSLGGCVYLSGEPAEFVGETQMRRNSAQDGGAMFLYAGAVLGPSSSTVLDANSAAVQGGALQLVGSLALMQVEQSHRLVMTRNTAGQHGGALAISLGAALNIVEEACPSACAGTMRGNGACEPQCMLAACRWDEGDCDALMRAAADDAPNACDRERCSPFQELVECAPRCFSASCDWNKAQCQAEKAQMRQCPMHDAAVFASQQSQPVVYAKGGSVGGYDSCASTCQPPDTLPHNLSWTAGAVGAYGMSVTSATAWLVAHNSGELDTGLEAFTLDVWVRTDSDLAQRGYVVSWERFGLFVAPMADQGYQVGVEKGGDVSFSTPTFLCTNGNPTIITDQFGLISDGEGNYPPNSDCGFIIAPAQAAGQCGRNELTVSFAMLDVEHSFDFLYVYACEDEACQAKTAVPNSPFTGRYQPFSVSSSTGVMQIMLASDQAYQNPGFVATFDARGENTPFQGTFLLEQWVHISVAVSADGTTEIYLNGSLTSTRQGDPLSHRPLGGGFSIGQRFLGPEMGKPGRFHGAVDEIRVWSGDRELPADIFAPCSGFDSSQDLMLCYGFEEGQGRSVGNSVSNASKAAEGVVGDRHLPWCVTSDDGGRLLDEFGSDVGLSWGFCSEGMPHLPAAAYNYNPEEMSAVATMSLTEIMEAYPDCGSNVLQFSDNRAIAGNGGAVYQADCDTAADARGLCFFTGMASGGGGMTLASFINNSAAGAGDESGAAYVECSVLGTSCDEALQLVLPFALSAETQYKVMMRDNVAGTREGDSARDVGTSPKSILLQRDPNASALLGHWMTSEQFEYVPGQSPLQLAVALQDDLQSLVISTPTVPNGFYVEVLLCATDGDCTASSALAPSTLHRFSRIAGDPMSRTIEGEQEVVCPVGETDVLVKMSLVGAPEVPSRSVTVSCLPCEAGQSRQEVSGNGGARVWRCMSCEPDQYVVDPNVHECQPCPARSNCDGSSQWDGVAGSRWRGDATSGLMLLEHCPPGHQLANTSGGVFSATSQHCKPCTPGLEYIIDPNRHQCEPCPVNSECDGSVMTDPVEGAVWIADASSGIYRLQSCPPGYQKVTEAAGLFTPVAQRCMPCTPGLQFIVDPNVHECHDCPTGGVCDGSILVGAVEGSVWEQDHVLGIYRLVSCPAGYQLVNSINGEFAVLQQQCLQCTPGLQYIVDPNRFECQDCPEGAACDGNSLFPRVEGSIWEVDNTSGLYKLTSCPAGHQKVTVSQDTQLCQPCTPGTQYIVDPNQHECQDCPAGALCPDGSRLLAGEEGDPRSAAVWEPDNLTGLYLLVSCPAGHQKITSSEGIFSPLTQQCKPCASGLEYVVDPDHDSCTPCPLGWSLGCDSFLETLAGPDGSRWEVLDGKLRLVECPAGNILIRDPAYPELDQCTLCAEDTFSLEPARWYDQEKRVVAERASSAQDRCLKCVEGVRCPGGAVLEPMRGFWRDSSGSLETANRRQQQGESTSDEVVITAYDVGVFPCPPHACTDDGTCAEGREGVVCGICSEGYSMAYGTCTPCEAGAEVTEPILASILVLLALLALYVCGYIPICGADEDGNRSSPGLTGRISDLLKVSRGSLPFLGWGKIIIGFYQVLSSFLATFPVDWPIEQQSVMQNGAVSRLDFMAQPGLNCLAGGYDYTQKLIVYLMAVPTVLFVLTLPSIYVVIVGLAMHGGWNKHPRFERVMHQFLWMTLFFIFLVYPTVSVVTLRSFNCQDLGGFGRKLTADYSVDCPRDDPSGFVFIWSLFFAVLYPAGIPVFFLVVLLVYKVPQMARTKMTEAAVSALVATYKRRTTSSLATNIQKKFGKHAQGRKDKAFKQSVEHFFGELADAQNKDDTSGVGRNELGPLSMYGESPLKGAVVSADFAHDESGGADAVVPDSRTRRASLRAGSITADSVKRGLAKAGLARHESEKLQVLLDKHATPSRRGGGEGELDLDKFKEVLDELVTGEQQFTGLERLHDMSRDQLKTLILFDWLRQSDAKDTDNRDAQGGEQNAIACPSSPTSPQVGRRKAKVERVLRRRGSLFQAHSSDVDLEEERRHELEQYSTAKLRNRVKDIAHRLLEARVIAVPHLEWNGDLGEQEQQALSHIGFLFKNYRVQCWYYELLEIIRKLITTAVMTFIFPGSPAQISAGFGVCFFFLMIAARLNPFVDHRLERMQIWALLALSLTLFYGLILVLQDAAPRPLTSTWMIALNWFFLFVNLSVIVYPLFQLYFGSRYAPGEIFKRQYRKWLRQVEAKRQERPDSFVVRAHDAAQPIKRSASFKRAPSARRQHPAVLARHESDPIEKSQSRSPGDSGGTERRTATTNVLPSGVKDFGSEHSYLSFPDEGRGLFVPCDEVPSTNDVLGPPLRLFSAKNFPANTGVLTGTGTSVVNQGDSSGPMQNLQVDGQASSYVAESDGDVASSRSGTTFVAQQGIQLRITNEHSQLVDRTPRGLPPLPKARSHGADEAEPVTVAYEPAARKIVHVHQQSKWQAPQLPP